MKRKISALIVSIGLIVTQIHSVSALGFEIPDFSELASDVSDGISDIAGDVKNGVSNAADQAGKSLSDISDTAGKGISDMMNQAGEAASDISEKVGKAASDVADSVGTTVSGAVDQASEMLSGFSAWTTKLASEWAKNASETTDMIKEKITETGTKLQLSAIEFGNATSEKASELYTAAGSGADEIVKSISGAADIVVDQAGHVVDLAAVSASFVTEAAGDAYEALEKNGTVIMNIAEQAVSDIDLSAEENWDNAKQAVNAAIQKAVKEGVLDKETDMETVQIITSLAFGTMMYGYQYSEGTITLGEYVSSMSEMIIKEGLPTGVGFVIDCLPLKTPQAKFFAKEAIFYLISIAYEDEEGEKIEEEEQMILKEAVETEDNKKDSKVASKEK